MCLFIAIPTLLLGLLGTACLRSARPNGVPRCLLDTPQDAPKTPQNAFKTLPRRPKTPQRRPQEAPKARQDAPRRPKTPPRRPKTSQDHPRRPQETPKTPPWRHLGPSWAHLGLPNPSQDRSKRPPRRLQDASQDEVQHRPQLKTLQGPFLMEILY